MRMTEINHFCWYLMYKCKIFNWFSPRSAIKYINRCSNYKSSYFQSKINLIKLCLKKEGTWHWHMNRCHHQKAIRKPKLSFRSTAPWSQVTLQPQSWCWTKKYQLIHECVWTRKVLCNCCKDSISGWRWRCSKYLFY